MKREIYHCSAFFRSRNDGMLRTYNCEDEIQHLHLLHGERGIIVYYHQSIHDILRFQTQANATPTHNVAPRPTYNAVRSKASSSLLGRA